MPKQCEEKAPSLIVRWKKSVRTKTIVFFLCPWPCTVPHPVCVSLQEVVVVVVAEARAASFVFSPNCVYLVHNVQKEEMRGGRISRHPPRSNTGCNGSNPPAITDRIHRVLTDRILVLNPNLNHSPRTINPEPRTNLALTLTTRPHPHPQPNSSP